MNWQAVYEAAKNCDGVTEQRADGVSRLIFPAGTVRLRQTDGEWKQLECPLTVAVLRHTERQRKLYQLLSSERIYFFWTMRDFAWALNLPCTPRWCGEIGKDLRVLGVYRGLKVNSRRKVYGLIDGRTQKPIPHCAVFSVLPFTTRPAEIRKAYHNQAAKRLAACQQMRSRG